MYDSMKVALYGRYFPEGYLNCLKLFFHRLNQRGVKVAVHTTFYEHLIQKYGYTPESVSLFNSKDQLDMDTACVFSLGGDGTFLEAVALVKDSGIPIAGINAGRLGFLTTISCDKIDEVLDAFFEESIPVENRTLIKAEGLPFPLSEFPYALNEFSIQKHGSAMVSINVYHDDTFINTYWSDGLLVATPTGSTAYSLSVGGPILTPDSASFVISPIAPHNLTVRPLVVPDFYSLKLEPVSRDGTVVCALDNRSVEVPSGTQILLTKASFTIKLLRLGEIDYFRRLRTKLMWGLDNRS